MRNKFAHDDEVFEADSLFEFNVHTFCRTRNEEVSVEFLAEFLHLSKTSLQTFCCTAHTYIVPHDATEFLVDRIYRALTLNCEELLDTCLNCFLSCLEFGEVCREAGNCNLVRKVVLNCVGKYEVTISKTLHQRRSTEAVCTVV